MGAARALRGTVGLVVWPRRLRVRALPREAVRHRRRSAPSARFVASPLPRPRRTTRWSARSTRGGARSRVPPTAAASCSGSARSAGTRSTSLPNSKLGSSRPRVLRTASETSGTSSTTVPAAAHPSEVENASQAFSRRDLRVACRVRLEHARAGDARWRSDRRAAEEPPPTGEAPAEPAPQGRLAFTQCDPENRPQACTREYRPVCAEVDNGVRCVTTPCDSTDQKEFGNGCTACSDAKTQGYWPVACAELTGPAAP
jgi:hypothetical protein